MKRMGFTALAVSALWLGGLSADDDKVDLKVGDKAPVFESTNDEGKAFKSSDVVGKKIVVVFFYPAALTGG